MNDAERTWVSLRRFFIARVGEHAVDAIEGKMHDTGLFLGAPQTFLAEIQSLADKPTDRRYSCTHG